MINKEDCDISIIIKLNKFIGNLYFVDSCFFLLIEFNKGLGCFLAPLYY